MISGNLLTGLVAYGPNTVVAGNFIGTDITGTQPLGNCKLGYPGSGVQVADGVRMGADDDQQPSCSAAEALERQHPFINQTLANHALALLSRLFRCEPMAYHGGFLNLTSGALVALRAEPKVWRRMRRRLRRAA